LLPFKQTFVNFSFHFAPFQDFYFRKITPFQGFLQTIFTPFPKKYIECIDNERYNAKKSRCGHIVAAA
jgi:hypothetical protein